MLKRTAALVFIAALTACGFYPENFVTIPGTLYIDAPHSEAGEALRRYFTQYTTVVDAREKAQLILTLISATVQQTKSNNALTSSLFSSTDPTAPNTIGGLSGTGYSASINLYTRLQFKLQSASGTVLIPPTTLAKSRAIVNDETKVLAKNLESQEELQTMRTRLFDAIARQISKVVENPATPLSPTPENPA